MKVKSIANLFNKKNKVTFAKIATTISLALVLVLLTSSFENIKVNASDESSVPYQSYNYNVWGESVPVPATYKVKQVIDGKTLMTKPFKDAGDLFVDENGNIYVLDSGNGRIVVLNKDFKVSRIISKITTGKTDKDGDPEIIDISLASGIYIASDESIWIACGANEGLINLRQDGSLIRQIKKPSGKNAPANLVFKPSKIAIGIDGTIYTVSEGVFQGIIEMSPDGTFLGYFGSNRVDVTLKVITELFWKKFFSLFSDTATENMIKIVPIEYSSIDMNSRGFIYAVTSDSLNSMFEIKKLDPKGNNIIRVKPSSDVPAGVVLNIGNYGDIETAYEQGTKVDTKFMDVSVDKQGFIYSLDAQRGRIFEYDQESNLIAIFGGLGSQRGCFENPVAVECVDDKILVLDKKTGEITVFENTNFGTSVRNATIKFNDGLYLDAENEWFSVLQQSTNYELAYTGIGKALFSRKQYAMSMKYYKLGYDKKGYDEAYTEYRKDIIRNNLTVILFGLLFILLLFFLIRKFILKKSKSKRQDLKTGKLQKLSYVLFHPFKASDDVRTENKGSIAYSIGIVSFLIITRILKIGLTGFLFNNARLEYIKITQEFFIIAGIYGIWILSNWAVSTLMEGEGRVRDITIVTANALIPLIVADILNLVLSNLLTIREGAFIGFISGLALYWTAMLLFIGIMTIHRYSGGRAIVSISFTIVGIIFILFLGSLVYSLFSQMLVFFGNIITEIMYRI